MIGPGDADQTTSLNVMANGDIFAGTDIGGVYKSSDNGSTWTPANNGINNLDITTKVIQSQVDNNLLFVGTRGGVYRSTNYSKSWQRLDNGLPKQQNYSLSGSIGGLVIDNKTVYVAMGYRPSSDGAITVRKIKGSHSIYKSIDNGNTWALLPAFQDETRISQLLVSHWDNKTIFASSSRGLFVTSDAGKNWNNVLNKPTYNILLDKDNRDVLYAAIGENGILKSTDSGKSWQPHNNGLPFFNLLGKPTNRYSILAADPDNTNIMYAINSTWSRSGGLYKSINKGNNWYLISNNLPESWLKTSRRMNDIAISKLNSNNLYLGSSRYIYSSNDKGIKWQQHISKRVDNGWTHTGINVFGQTRTLKVDVKDANTMYIATADHKIIRSKNNGTSWNLLLEGEKKVHNVWDIDQCTSSSNKLHIITSDTNNKLCILNSEDQGDTWNKNCSIPGLTSRKEKIRISPHNCNIILVASKIGVLRSLDAGKSWESIIINSNGNHIRAITFDKANKNTVYAGTDMGLFISIDNGETWEPVKSTRNLMVTAIHISPTNSDIIYIGTQTSSKGPGAIYKSNDHGLTWEKNLNDIRRYVSAITSLPAQPDYVYASTQDDNYHDISKGKGIYRSIDQGSTWHRIDNNLPVFRAYDITTSSLRPYEIFLATCGSGAYVANEKETLLRNK
ncbi:MAG: YCF48-related protein [Gammaproteobacteria bacterium]|nr:YCF48-related protein [Gammaproteobacteria bacterium]